MAKDSSDQPAQSGRKKASAKTEVLVIRINPDDRKLVAAAAAADDLEVSTWARRAILRAARQWHARRGDTEQAPDQPGADNPAPGPRGESE